MSAVRIIEREFIIEAMYIHEAPDRWLGEMTRKRRRPRTLDRYRDTLYKFVDTLPARTYAKDVKAVHCEAFLDRWNSHAAGTSAAAYTPLNGMFAWLYKTRQITRNPMEFIDPPRRQRPEDIDVTTVTTEEVARMFAAARTFRERMCLLLLASLGPRRHAASELRIGDYDREERKLRFYEKGGKTIRKPVPQPLVDLIEQGLSEGRYRRSDDYLIPPGERGPRAKRQGRMDKVVYTIVKNLASRAGVTSDVHALRRAFAVHFIDEYGELLETLRILMGHESIETTRRYAKARNRDLAMEIVRDFSWPEIPQIAAGKGEGVEIRRRRDSNPRRNESLEDKPSPDPSGGRDDLVVDLTERLPKLTRERT